MELTDHANLPEDERARRVGTPSLNQEVRRLQTLIADRRRVDAEICDEAVFGRDPREHRRVKAFGARAADRLVRHINEHAGMSIEHGTDVRAAAYLRQDAIDDELKCVPA